jgi:hypothetical protein
MIWLKKKKVFHEPSNKWVNINLFHT